MVISCGVMSLLPRGFVGNKTPGDVPQQTTQGIWTTQKKIHDNENVKTSKFYITKEKKKTRKNFLYVVMWEYMLWICVGVYNTNIMRMKMCFDRTYLCVCVVVKAKEC